MVVGQSKALFADLLREHAVLLYDVVNDLGVVAVDPAGGRGEKELEREQVGHDAPIVPVGRMVVTRPAAVQSRFRIARALDNRPPLLILTDRSVGHRPIGR